MRYQVLGFGTIVKLIIKAMNILGLNQTLQVASEFPALIDMLFTKLTTKQRNLLIEALVNELDAQSRLAFDCLNRLLET